MHSNVFPVRPLQFLLLLSLKWVAYRKLHDCFGRIWKLHGDTHNGCGRDSTKFVQREITNIIYFDSDLRLFGDSGQRFRQQLPGILMQSLIVSAGSHEFFDMRDLRW